MIWIAIGSVVLFGWFLGFALCRAAAKGDRDWERAYEELVEREDPRAGLEQVG